MTGGVQLPLAIGSELPFDPKELALLTAPERGQLYRKLGLDPVQIQAAEEATRLVIAKAYRRKAVG